MKSRLSSHFDRLFPNMERHAQKQQANQARHHDNAKSLRLFSVGDHVIGGVQYPVHIIDGLGSSNWYLRHVSSCPVSAHNTSQ